MSTAGVQPDILQGRRIIVGVCGGIAAYKVCGLVSALRQRGAEVRVVMTANAEQFVTPTTFATLSGHEVVSRMFGHELGDAADHIRLQDFGEVLLVAPATANILGKVASGIADDLLSTTILAARCPVIFAPAMNCQMWENAIVQDNVARLQRFGYGFVMPEAGRLACGTTGAGRLAAQPSLLAALETALAEGDLDLPDLSGWRIVVSAGPTREALDPVRFLSNRSTGRMGYALAEAAQRCGAEVTLVSGPTELPPPAGVGIKRVTTCAEMKAAVLEAVPGADVFISAAAPADYRPATVSEIKIKKGDDLSLPLVRTDDILQTVATQCRPRFLVGFAAETGDAVETARGKLQAKNLDLLVVNDVLESGSGFGTDTNRVVILGTDGTQQALPLMSKSAVAVSILQQVARLEEAHSG